MVGEPSLFPPEPLPGNDGASGSGCAPGRDSLPDGIWFGLVTSPVENEMRFDLACFYFGDIAEEKAAAAGEEALGGFWIANANPAPRSISVAPSLPVYWITFDTEFDLAQFHDWRSDPSGYSNCPGSFCFVWIYVNGGSVTEVMEQYLP